MDLIQWRLRGRVNSVHEKHGLLYATDTERGDAWIFSGRGFLRSALRDNRKIKRGWGGEIQLVQLESAGENSQDLVQSFTPEAGRSAILDQHRAALERFNKPGPLPSCEPERYVRDERKFRSIYGEVPVLPPDQYRSLLVNLTEGCSHNRCSFCTFYRDRGFTVKLPSSFHEHVEAVRDFFGPDLRFFNGFFLGEGDALTAPTQRLTKALKYLQDTDCPVANDVACFGQGHTVRLKSPTELQHLKRLGLNRVYLGLETASPTLLNPLNKPFSLPEFRETIHELKHAGLNTGIMVMIGVGGRSKREQHRRRTLEFLHELPLGRRDRIYLSPLVESRFRDPSEKCSRDPLTAKERERELLLFEEALSPDLPAIQYKVENFLY